ncbi:MAG: Asp-tRNA(Asn)/Glu-tRNA(Gln) amidotransferase subunit GatB [Kiritimatiellia bacterium]
MDYEITIGLETHVQLKTQTKMFCGCGTEFGANPNSHVCPVCLGYPGALPSMNEEAIRFTVLAGLMLGCKINSYAKFDRKNYFYPDMSKNYQITQLDYPLCLGGAVDIETASGKKAVRLTRIHLEEDVAKLTHRAGCSGVDYNRAGLPLMEIVSEPDMCSVEEAMAYLASLKEMMIYAGVSECNLEEGNMRSDVNISLRPNGQKQLGTKIEIKNMNTFSGIHAALLYEINRQRLALDAGQTLHQETRRWDPELGETQVMRTKENADDYRYFPEPDLMPIVLTAEQIYTWGKQLPEAPGKRRERMVADYGIPEYDAGVLSAERAWADFFEATVKYCGNGKLTSNWMMAEVLGLVTKTGTTLQESALTPESFGELLTLIDTKAINGPTAKALLPELFEKGGSAKTLVKERGLGQVSDTGAIESFVTTVLEANPKVVADYKAGKQAAFGFLVGQVMKQSKGKASPQMVGDLLKQKLA